MAPARTQGEAVLGDYLRRGRAAKRRRQPSGGAEAAALLRRSRSWLCRAGNLRFLSTRRDHWCPPEALHDRCDTDAAQTRGQTILPTLRARARKRIHRLSARPDTT
jgi:hypothetical protein